MHSGDIFRYLLSYIDDILIAIKSKHEVEQFKIQLSNEFGSSKKENLWHKDIPRQ